MYLLDIEGGGDILNVCFEENKKFIEGFFAKSIWSLTTNTGAAVLRAAYAAGKLPKNYQEITVGEILNLTNWDLQIKLLSALVQGRESGIVTIDELCEIFEDKILELLTHKKYDSKSFYTTQKGKYDAQANKKAMSFKNMDRGRLSDKLTEKETQLNKKISSFLEKGFYESLIQFITELDDCIATKVETKEFDQILAASKKELVDTSVEAEPATAAGGAGGGAGGAGGAGAGAGGTLRLG